MNNLLNENNYRAIRVLVIDDSDIIQRALKSFLQEFDIEVLTCSNGLEGIQLAIETKPRLIFLDLMMPNLDGIKMLQVKQVLAEIRDIPVVIISANTNKQNVLSAMELGAVKVISKPLQKDVIIKALKEVFQHEWESFFADNMKNGKDSMEISDKAQEKVTSDFKGQLMKIFLKNFTNQKKQIIEAIEVKDKVLLKGILHDIKGAGGTVGSNSISEIAKVIHNRDINSDLDWFFIQVKCEQLFKEVKKIEDLTFSNN